MSTGTMTVKTKTDPRTGLKPWGTAKQKHADWHGSHYDRYPNGPDGKLFFSRISKVHEIGDFIIVEHIRGPVSNVPGSGGETMFAVYVKNLWVKLWNDSDDLKREGYEFYSSSYIFHTLDEALLHAITLKHEANNFSLNHANNSQVGQHFWAMVGGAPKEDS